MICEGYMLLLSVSRYLGKGGRGASVIVVYVYSIQGPIKKMAMACIMHSTFKYTLKGSFSNNS